MVATKNEVLPVKAGLSTLDKPMTAKQARRWGEANMPRDLRRAGFEVCLFRSDPEIHGGDWFRVSYGAKVPGHSLNWRP